MTRRKFKAIPAVCRIMVGIACIGLVKSLINFPFVFFDGCITCPLGLTGSQIRKIKFLSQNFCNQKKTPGLANRQVKPGVWLILLYRCLRRVESSRNPVSEVKKVKNGVQEKYVARRKFKGNPAVEKASGKWWVVGFPVPREEAHGRVFFS